MLLDIAEDAEDAEVRNGTSSINKSVENLPLIMAEDAEVGDNGDDVDNKTVKRSPLSKKPNGPIKYLTSLYFRKKWVFLNSFGYS